MNNLVMRSNTMCALLRVLVFFFRVLVFRIEEDVKMSRATSSAQGLYSANFPCYISYCAHYGL